MHTRPFRFAWIRLAACALLMVMVGLPALPGRAAQMEGDLVLAAVLDTSYLKADRVVAHIGEAVVYTIAIINTSTTTDITGVQVTNPLPATLEYVAGSLNASSGAPNDKTSGVIAWSGTVNSASTVTVTYRAVVKASAPWNQTITNTLSIAGGGESYQRNSIVMIEPRKAFLPIVGKGCLPLFADTFGSSGSGWPVIDDGDTLSQYIGGEYHMLLRTAPGQLFRRPGVKAEDFGARVDVRNANGVYGSYGLAFDAAPDWSTLYTFEIYPDNHNGFNYGIYRWDNDRIVTLVEAYSPDVYEVSLTNQIEVVRIGAQIKVFANGKHLTSVSDGTYTGSRNIGLVAFSYDNPDVDVYFDNFMVNPVGCLNAAELQSATVDTPGVAPSGGSQTSTDRVVRQLPERRP